jgi:ribose transport system substrate-binding protein
VTHRRFVGPNLVSLVRCSLAALLAAIVLGGCSQPKADPAGGDELAGEEAADGGARGADERLSLVMIPKATQATFWNSVRRGAERAATEFGVDLAWMGPARDNDRAEQKKVLQQFLNEGVDGILLAPTDSKALIPDVQTAKAKHIPVLIFDSAIEGEAGTDFISFVATDNEAAGRLGGKHLMSLIGNGGKAILFRHMEGHASTMAREEGALEELTAGGAELLVDNRFSGETSVAAMSTAIAMMDQINAADGVFASNQTSAEGMLLALRQTNLAGRIKFVGFDSSEPLVDGLRNGEISALVVQDPDNMGYTSVKLMVDHLRGREIEPTVNTSVHLVTQENMDDAEIAPLLQ